MSNPLSPRPPARLRIHDITSARRSNDPTPFSRPPASISVQTSIKNLQIGKRQDQTQMRSRELPRSNDHNDFPTAAYENPTSPRGRGTLPLHTSSAARGSTLTGVRRRRPQDDECLIESECQTPTTKRVSNPPRTGRTSSGRAPSPPTDAIVDPSSRWVPLPDFFL